MDRHNARWIVGFLVLGALGLATFLHLYDEAFPSASLDFKVTREQAVEMAEAYLADLGYSTEGYELAQAFGHDQSEQIFLERTVGLQEANRLAREWISVWAWNVRWFKPLEKEEFRVLLDPGGRVVNFSHRIMESAEGARIAQDDALPIAERFLSKVQHFGLEGYELIERSSVERKARTDHTFTYRRRDFTIGDDGHYRLVVVVHGDRVGVFAEYLKVPESFARGYRETRSRGDLLAQVAGIFWMFLGVGMLVVLVQKYREGSLRWRSALLVGAAVALALGVEQFNALPLLRFQYRTTEAYTYFIANRLLMGLLGALLLGGVVCLVGTSGNALGSEVLHGGRSSPLGRLSLRRMMTPASAGATFVGYGLAFAHLGYVTLFYVIGTRYLGVWSPAEMTDYNNTFSTALPWLYPLLIGLMASTLEEFFFRLLAISLLIKYLKRPWAAVLCSAVVWGFLHSNYPVEPVFTRGLELTVVGVVLGVVFLRFGIWATLISHYAYNAFLVSFPMLKSTSLYFQVSGIVVVGVLLVPAVPALLGAFTGRYREDEDEEMEQAPGPEPDGPGYPAPGVGPDSEAPEAEGAPQRSLEAYVLSRGARRVAVLAGLSGLAMAMLFREEKFGERTLEHRVTRTEAARLASELCAEEGLGVEGYRRVAWFRSTQGSQHFTHLLREAGVARADTLASEETSPWMWTVRWFRPLEKEEIRVGVDASGHPAMFEHTIPETRAGAEVSADSARSAVEAFVRRHLNRDLTDTTRYKELEARSRKRASRLDHHFVWERVDRKVGDGEFRVVTRVQGDRVGHVHLTYKAPEAFLRELNRKRAMDIIPTLFMMAFMIPAGVVAVVAFFKSIRAGQVTWGLPLRVGAFGAILTLIATANGLPRIFQGYDTSQAMGTYLGRMLIGRATVVAMAGLGIAVATAAAVAVFRRFRPQEAGPEQWLRAIWSRAGSFAFWRDTLILGAALALVESGTSQFEVFAKHTWLAGYLKPAGTGPPGLDLWLPFVGAATGALWLPVVLPLLAAFVVVWLRIVKRRSALALLFLALAIVMGAGESAESTNHFLALAGLDLVTTLGTVLLVGWVVRYHVLAYVMAIWSMEVLGRSTALLGTGMPWYQANGAALLIFGLVPLAIVGAAYLRQRKAGETAARG